MTKLEGRIAMLFPAIAMAFELGCAARVVNVGALDVAPKLPLPRQEGRLALALAPATPDAIRIQAHGFPVVEVSAFRATLRRAFERAFAPSFALAGPGTSDAVLMVEVTDIAFVTERNARARRGDRHGAFGAAIVLAHGSVPQVHKASTRRVRYAQLRFAATLRERGAPVARLVGLATAAQATAGSEESVAASLGSAVAVLYQRIAREFFLGGIALVSREEH